MKTLLAGAVAGCMLMHPVLAVAQTAPAPLVPSRASIERSAEDSLTAAVQRQTAALALVLARADERAPIQAAPAQPRENRSWIGRHPALFGALVGAAAGTLTAGTMDNEMFCQTGSDEDCFFYNGSRFAVGAGIGAGVGALAGWIVGLGRR